MLLPRCKMLGILNNLLFETVGCIDHIFWNPEWLVTGSENVVKVFRDLSVFYSSVLFSFPLIHLIVVFLLCCLTTMQGKQGLSTDNLVFLLAKQLSPSGVSSLGRIVLPKVVKML